MLSGCPKKLNPFFRKQTPLSDFPTSQQLRKKVLFYYQKLSSVPVTQIPRKSLQVLRFSHDLIRLFIKKLKKFHKKNIFSMILLAIILLLVKSSRKYFFCETFFAATSQQHTQKKSGLCMLLRRFKLIINTNCCVCCSHPVCRKAKLLWTKYE